MSAAIHWDRVRAWADASVWLICTVPLRSKASRTTAGQVEPATDAPWEHADFRYSLIVSALQQALVPTNLQVRCRNAPARFSHVMNFKTHTFQGFRPCSCRDGPTHHPERCMLDQKFEIAHSLLRPNAFLVHLCPAGKLHDGMVQEVHPFGLPTGVALFGKIGAGNVWMPMCF